MSDKERTYWNNRYSLGMDSGSCSVGKLKDWRWKIIKKHAKLKNKSVLDVGCGDLRFWDGVKHTDYTGIDISKVIIEQNRVNKPNWFFICEDASIPSNNLMADIVFYLMADVVFCFEMLFHIMTEESYIRILQNLNRWTKETLFVSCWSERPEPLVFQNYQAHYQLDEYLHLLPDLELKKKYTIEKGLRALYVFERGTKSD